MMKYISTRGNFQRVSSAEAIRLGMVPEGGLFVPEKIPEMTLNEILALKDYDYPDLAVEILKKYLTDFSEAELRECVDKAYNKENFSVSDIAPLKKLEDDTYVLELWHGPTAAFKDMALQLMPHLLSMAIEKGNIDREVVILVATSGDTGKAALEGFKDVDGVRIIVFYPQNGVSQIQKAQMVTTGGENTEVVAVNGNFDDCQNAVKSVFGDSEFNEYINKNGYRFSSANSINWGRLVPQIVYYFKAYLDLVNEDEIDKGQKTNFVVPTGNFGDILAGYYAYRMGLPVEKLVCASNVNKVLTDIIKTGEYDLDREFKKTISPSMDILISSNLERFLFSITGQNHRIIKKWYKALHRKGKFKIDTFTHNNLTDVISGEYADEEDTKFAINFIFEEYDYLIDPHTAVGVCANKDHDGNVPERWTSVLLSTASPFKFGRAVLSSILERKVDGDDFEIVKQLENVAGTKIHRALKNLEESPVKHKTTCGTDEIKSVIKNLLDTC